VIVLPGQLVSAITVFHEHGLHVLSRLVGRELRRSKRSASEPTLRLTIEWSPRSCSASRPGSRPRFLGEWPGWRLSSNHRPSGFWPMADTIEPGKRFGFNVSGN
jgi:hypothetical protein